MVCSWDIGIEFLGSGRGERFGNKVFEATGDEYGDGF